MAHPYKKQCSSGREMARERYATGGGLYANIHAKRERIAHGSGEKMRKPGSEGAPTAEAFRESAKTAERAKGGAAWTRAEGQNPEGGLNAKGRASARAQGMNLKPPAPHPKTEKDAARRKSFCARMSGMKKKLTSAETAKDPDSRINKSLRAWNC